MRVSTSWAEGLKARDCPLKPSEVRRLFGFLDARLKATPAMKKALEKLGTRRVGAVSLRFCSDEEMRGLQLRYRKLDRTTDILSFPTLDMTHAQMMLRTLPPTERSWGDLVVSLATVERGARRARRPFADELTEVLIHGFLHLLGFDHIVGPGVRPVDAREMKALQRRIFREWTARG